MKLGRKWRKPDALKKRPLIPTPLVTAVMAYGHACQEYGRWSARALREKINNGPRAKEFWALSFAAQESMEDKLRDIAHGWPTLEQHGNYVAPPKESDDEDMAAAPRSEAVHPGDVGEGPLEVGSVEPPED